MAAPVLPEHISSTNPLLCAHPDLEARQELEELHASMVYRGKRFTKQEVRVINGLQQQQQRRRQRRQRQRCIFCSNLRQGKLVAVGSSCSIVHD